MFEHPEQFGPSHPADHLILFGDRGDDDAGADLGVFRFHGRFAFGDPVMRNPENTRISTSTEASETTITRPLDTRISANGDSSRDRSLDQEGGEERGQIEQHRRGGDVWTGPSARGVDTT
jgi:hypothetical protein